MFLEPQSILYSVCLSYHYFTTKKRVVHIIDEQHGFFKRKSSTTNLFLHFDFIFQFFFVNFDRTTASCSLLNGKFG